MEQKNNTSTIKSVDKALEVLEAFSRIHDGINLSRLSEKLNMNKSGVYRLLQVFKQRGYVEQRQKNGKYHLSMAAYMISQNIISNMELLRNARPVMEKMARDCNETVYLAVRCEQDVLLFDNVDSMTPVNVLPLKGHRYPLSSCAAGKVLMAFDAADDDGPGPVGSPQDQSLKAISQRGYVADEDCLGEGISSLAVPLLATDKKLVGSICFVGPQYRFTDEKINDELLIPLVNAGHAISAKLGYFGYHIG